MPNGAHGLVTVHFRHHDIHQHQVDLRPPAQQFDASPSVFRVHHVQVVLLQQTGKREDIAHVVIHYQDRLPAQSGIGAAEVLQNAALCRSEIGLGAVDQQNRIVEQAF